MISEKAVQALVDSFKEDALIAAGAPFVEYVVSGYDEYGKPKVQIIRKVKREIPKPGEGE